MTIPTSPEAFRVAFGRAPTVAEMRACIDFVHPPAPRAAVTNGCDCYDPECYTCTDDSGNPRNP